MHSPHIGTRVGSLAGLAFLALLVTGSGLVSTAPGPDSSPAQIVRAYGALDHVAAGAACLAFAGCALLWFATTLRSLLVRSEGGAGRVASVVLAGASVAAALLAVSGSVHGAVDARLDAGAGAASNGEAAAVAYLHGVANSLLALAFAPLGVMALATAAVAVRHTALPRWYVAVAALSAALLLVGSTDVAGDGVGGLLGTVGLAVFFVVTPLATFARMGELTTPWE